MQMRILSRADMEQVLTLSSVMDTVEQVYRLKAENKTVVWPTVFHDFKTGEQDMDIKSGYLRGMETHGLKVINWTAANEARGLPALVGLIMVFDTETGVPLGVLDGSYITGVRTGCAGAIGAKYLARGDSRSLFVLGTGGQAFFQTAAFLHAFPQLRRVYIANPRHGEKADAFVSTIRERLQAGFGIDASGVEFIAAAADAMGEAVGSSDMIVTTTPSRSPLLKAEWIKPGTHLSCIGADMSGKQEIESAVFRNAVIVCDDHTHCMEAGEMELPLREGIIAASDIRCEIGEIILCRAKGRENSNQVTIYDACGMALLDIACAKAALKLAEQNNIGQIVEI